MSEDTLWPGHIVPVVQVYKWIGEEIPSLDSLPTFKLLEQRFFSTVLQYHPDIERKYQLNLLSTSEKMIPKENLTFLGNIPGNDLIPFRGHDYYSGNAFAEWKGKIYSHVFEHYIIDMYLSWRSIN